MLDDILADVGLARLVADDALDHGESFALAKSTVYVAPISDDNDPAQTISPRPDAKYGTAALRVAKSQALLAGYRLAELLNTHLK